MENILIITIAILVLIILILCIAILKKNKQNDIEDLKKELRHTKEDIVSNIGGKIVDNTTIQQTSITNLTTLNETKLENIRKSVEEKLQAIQKDNGEKLEKMRLTVDEKLQSTLEKRLSESFKIVSNNLESVQKGLGEMQTLAKGVGDLKNVFTNVKARGYWGEIQLGNILEQFLTKEQYLTSVKTKKNSNDFVEFAIKFPGKNNTDYVLLPVDSKFPIEDYTRLVQAEEASDTEKIIECKKALVNQIKKCAKDINEKYLDPPYTTDFGIMFLPTESLYSEVIRNTDLCEVLSQKYRVVVSGPSTFIALLNSLQMGFRTLAIQKRSSEVWELLGTVKTEFSKFGDLLDKTNKKLMEISNTMSDATRKTRTIERKLKNVEALPISDNEFYDILDVSNEDQIAYENNESNA